MKRVWGIAFLATLISVGPAKSATLVQATFQEGVGGYTGAVERRIGLSGNVPIDGASVNTDSVSFFLDGGPTATDRADALVRFDNALTTLPAGAKVISANLQVKTTSATVSTNSQSNGTFNVYTLNSPFDSTATFQNFAGGNGGGIDGDVGAIVGSFDGQTTADSVVRARVDRAVESWLSGGPNYGLGVRSDRSTDGWSLHTSGAGTLSNRPLLDIVYTTSDKVDVSSYAPSKDSFPNGISGATVGTVVDGSSLEQAFIDGDNSTGAADSFDQPYLIAFDNLDLDFVEILQAELIFVSGFSSGAADSTESWTIHQMLRDWDNTTTYASFDSDGNPALTNSAELIANGAIATAATTLPNVNDTEMVHLDVTSIVDAWRLGAPNYGIYVGPGSGTDNGWQIFTSGAMAAGFRPELRIVGVRVPEPSAALLLALGSLLAVGYTQRR